MKALMERALPHLFVVTINGADMGDNWDMLIQPLDEGAYDVFGFVKTLVELGYDGPIGLQGYGVRGDARENLRKSVTGWRELSERMAAGE